MKLNEPPPLPPPRKRLDTETSSLPRTFTSPESDYIEKKKWNIFKRTKKREKRVLYQPKELNKRNSFSTPDLYTPDIENLNMSNHLNSSNSFELDYLYKDDSGKLSDEEVYLKNISNNIKFNFEPSFSDDISKVNLVGSGFNLDKNDSTTTSKNIEEADNQLLKNDILYRLKYSFDSPITIKREFDYDSPRLNVNESLYMPMNGRKISPKQIQLQLFKDDEHAYVPMNFAKPHDDESSVISRENKKNKRYSVDDKIPSYYPNYDHPISRIEKSPSSDDRNKSSRHPAVLDKEKSFSLNKINRSDSFHSRSQQTPSCLTRKYATLDRVSSSVDRLKENRPREKIEHATIASTLSRLKKLNFSPLREKISNVIQRNNSK